MQPCWFQRRQYTLRVAQGCYGKLPLNLNISLGVNVSLLVCKVHVFESVCDEFLAPVRLVVSGCSCEGETSSR